MIMLSPEQQTVYPGSFQPGRFLQKSAGIAPRKTREYPATRPPQSTFNNESTARPWLETHSSISTGGIGHQKGITHYSEEGVNCWGARVGVCMNGVGVRDCHELQIKEFPDAFVIRALPTITLILPSTIKLKKTQAWLSTRPYILPTRCATLFLRWKTGRSNTVLSVWTTVHYPSRTREESPYTWS